MTPVEKRLLIRAHPEYGIGYGHRTDGVVGVTAFFCEEGKTCFWCRLFKFVWRTYNVADDGS